MLHAQANNIPTTVANKTKALLVSRTTAPFEFEPVVLPGVELPPEPVEEAIPDVGVPKYLRSPVMGPGTAEADAPWPTSPPAAC